VIKLKDILFEKDDRLDSENPDRILVKNKKSGELYYINKDNFDQSIHDKPKGREASAKTGDDKTSDDKQKKSGNKDDEKNKEKPEDSSSEDTSTSKFLMNSYEMDALIKKSKSIRPDLEKKLLAYNYDSLFDEYNNLQIQGVEPDKLKSVIRKFQTVSLAKFSLISQKENDVNVIESALIYRSNANEINDILQKNEELIPREQIERELEKKDQPEELKYELKKTLAIYVLDEHFKTDGAKLENAITVYRAVDKSIIDQFESAGTWTDNGFVSTSLNPVISELSDSKERNPLLAMYLKTGDPILILSKDEDKYFFETEVTLPRGCSFTLGKYDKVKNAYLVLVEYPNA
jgi:hypothetical protein